MFYRYQPWAEESGIDAGLIYYRRLPNLKNRANEAIEAPC